MFNNIYKDKKILITGNTGFKGSWLSSWLLKLGADVYGFANDISTNPSMYGSIGLFQKVKHSIGDVRNLTEVKDVINDIEPDFVFHLAAQALVSVSYDFPSHTLATNIMGTANVLESLKQINKKCIGVIITSDKCYDNVEWEYGYRETDKLGGKDIYSGSKAAAEIVINSYYHSYFSHENSNVRIATARAGNVIGGGDWGQDRIVPDCIRHWSNNEVVIIRCPESTRPWQHVLEPLSGYLTLGMHLSEDSDLNGECFNFGPITGTNKTVVDLIKDLGQYWDYSEYKITSDIKFHEAGLLKLNCDKALMKFKWFSTLNHKELIKLTGHWYREFYLHEKDMFKYTLSQINTYEDLAIRRNLPWTK